MLLLSSPPAISAYFSSTFPLGSPGGSSEGPGRDDNVTDLTSLVDERNIFERSEKCVAAAAFFIARRIKWLSSQRWKNDSRLGPMAFLRSLARVP